MANDVRNLTNSIQTVDGKITSLTTKVDGMDDKMQRIEGVVAIVRFLGVGGVVIAAAALLKAFGGL